MIHRSKIKFLIQDQLLVQALIQIKNLKQPSKEED